LPPAETAQAKPALQPAKPNQQAPAKPQVAQNQRPAALTPAERAQVNQSLARMEDALFDYDKSNIRADATRALQEDVGVVRNILADHPRETIRVEGNCDQRGSEEYNVGLGDRRAQAVKDFLTNMGLASSQLMPISYGKDRPVCTDASEDCWQRNRRVHLVLAE
jgi:peptidoglycan-associated lipoprotein